LSLANVWNAGQLAVLAPGRWSLREVIRDECRSGGPRSHPPVDSASGQSPCERPDGGRAG